MVGKLIKHEFRATARVMLIMLAIMLSVSLLANVSIRYMGSSSLPDVFRILMVFNLLAFFIAIIAGYIVWVVITVKRFKDNVLSDEGYLTMTLPVSVHGIIWSKIIVSVVWLMAISVMSVLSVLVLFVGNVSLTEVFSDIGEFIAYLSGQQAADFITAGILWLVGTLVSMIASCLMFYAALSIGHGFAKHKMGMSVLFYFVLSYGFSIVFNTFLGGFQNQVIEIIVYQSEEGVISLSRTLMLWSVITGAIEGVVCYVLTWWSLRKRLNLE